MSNKILTIRTLGNNGRFGNQILQYCFAKGLAREYGAELEVPDGWIGRKIFQIEDRGITKNNAIQTSIDDIPTQEQLDYLGTIDLHGYYQYQEACDLYSITDLRHWLKFIGPCQQYIKEKAIASINQTTLVVHKRRGDYTQKPDMYCNISDQSFDKIITQVRKDMPDNTVVKILTEENPTQVSYLDAAGIGFMADFIEMMFANCLIRSNSTFSLTAGWYNRTQNIWAPVVGEKTGWQDVEWVNNNSPVMAPPSIHAQFGTQLTDLHLSI